MRQNQSQRDCHSRRRFSYRLVRLVGRRTVGPLGHGFPIAAVAAILLLTGCTAAVSPHSSPTPEATVRQMTPEESKAEVMDLYNAIAKTVGGNWIVGTSTWGDCDPGATYFDFGAQRLAQPLQADPDNVASRVKAVMVAHGYSVRVQHDPSLTPPRAVIGYPGGYLQGSEPDGFGFQFTVGKNYADFNLTGHCVLGDSYYLNTGKHL